MKFKFCASAAIKKPLEPLIAQVVILSTHLVTKIPFTFTKAIITLHKVLKNCQERFLLKHVHFCKKYLQ